MIVRFMKNGKVCEISDDDCPILVYPNEKEKTVLWAIPSGQALVVGTEDKHDMERLNTEKDPIRLI